MSGIVAVAFGHSALAMLVIKSGMFTRIMRRFAGVGRMALTSYLLHSIVLTSIFCGYGLGLYGQIPRMWQMAFVAGVLSMQLIISPISLQGNHLGS